MLPFSRFLIVLVSLALCALASNASIGPGSPAPALSVQTWFKGKPVKKLDRNKIYVVEFWATWCGPCIQTIPHLTELAKKNKDVTFIGVSIWEDDKDGNIKKFIDKMGEKMDYNVGYSGNKTGMSQTWMQAAGQDGIPTSFIVKNNQVQWIGHPSAIAKPLAEIKAGTFDLKAFKAHFDKEAETVKMEAEAEQAEKLAQPELDAVWQLIADGNLAEAKLRVVEIEKKHPSLAVSSYRVTLRLHKFRILAWENPAQWEKQAKAFAVKKDFGSRYVLLLFALGEPSLKRGSIAAGTKAMDLAIEAYEAAGDTKNVVMLHGGVNFYRETRNYKKSLTLVEKLLAIYSEEPYKSAKEAREKLEKLKAELTEKIRRG
jgi:thiol-disulfide isomerase/thioredoxin